MYGSKILSKPLATIFYVSNELSQQASNDDNPFVYQGQWWAKEFCDTSSRNMEVFQGLNCHRFLVSQSSMVVHSTRFLWYLFHRWHNSLVPYRLFLMRPYFCFPGLSQTYFSCGYSAFHNLARTYLSLSLIELHITLTLGGVHKLRLQDEVGRWLSKCQQMLTEVGRWSVICKR